MVRNTQNAKAHKVKSTGGTSINKKLKNLHSSVRGTVASALANGGGEPSSSRAVAPAPISRAVELEKQVVGRAIVLAHGAGGSSSHGSIKAWKRRLEELDHPCGPDLVFPFDFPKPHSIDTQVAAFIAAIRRVRKMGHRRIVVAGVGMGARVALSMLTGVVDDEGGAAAAADEAAAGDAEAEANNNPNPLPEVPPAVRASIVGVLALGYPLMRIGSDVPRDKALRSLPADSPPLMLMVGANDPHVDLSKLEEAKRSSASEMSLYTVDGGDASLKIAGGAQLVKEGTAAMDTALSGFFERTLGSQAEWSKEVMVDPNAATAALKKKVKKAVVAPAAASTAAGSAMETMGGHGSLNELEELQRLNREQQLEAKVRDREERKEEQQRQREAAEASRAAALAEAEAEKRKKEQVDAPLEIVLSGCGSEEVNGLYQLDGMRDGAPSYRKAGADGDAADGAAAVSSPSFTIERDSAPDQATQWCLCINYGFVSWAFVDSESDLPPMSGWVISEEAGCKGPPPSLAKAEGSAGAELPAEPVLAEEEADEEEAEMMEEHAGGSSSMSNAAAKGNSKKKFKKGAKGGMKVSRGITKKMNALKRSGKLR